MSALLTDVESASGWHACLGLGFESRAGRTVARVLERLGPLCIQRPFYPEGDVSHVYLLHPPGGVVGGDTLELNARVEGGAAALLTTPAATKIYRSGQPVSVVQQTLYVASAGRLEWLPQETILFGGSRARLRTNIELFDGARFFGWELVVLGRSRSGDTYAAGNLDQRLMVSVNGVPLSVDRQRWQTGDAFLRERWGLAGQRAYAFAYAYPADEDDLDLARRTIARAGHDLGGATLLENVLVVRVLGQGMLQVRPLMVEIWQSLRPSVMQRQPVLPRVWAT